MEITVKLKRQAVGTIFLHIVTDLNSKYIIMTMHRQFPSHDLGEMDWAGSMCIYKML